MFLSVMLLNFLIAIISQSYEEVMSTALTSQYSQRCELNNESFAILNFFSRFKSNPKTTLKRFQVNNSGIFIVSTSYLTAQYQVSGGEWHGFVNTLKQFMHREMDHMKNTI